MFAAAAAAELDDCSDAAAGITADELTGASAIIPFIISAFRMWDAAENPCLSSWS